MTKYMSTIACHNNFGEEVVLPKEKFVFRPSVYGVITRDKSVLLRNKSNGKLWLPGGGVELGERMKEGLEREITEETGIKVEIGELLFFRENFFYYQPLDEAYHAFLFFCSCRPKSVELLADHLVDDFESQRPRWIPFSELTSDDFADFSEDIYHAIKTLLEKPSL